VEAFAEITVITSASDRVISDFAGIQATEGSLRELLGLAKGQAWHL
jgi:hypothetical protein